MRFKAIFSRLQTFLDDKIYKLSLDLKKSLKTLVNRLCGNYPYMDIKLLLKAFGFRNRMLKMKVYLHFLVFLCCGLKYITYLCSVFQGDDESYLIFCTTFKKLKNYESFKFES